MSPTTFGDAFERRRQVRKRGVPAPLPPAVQRVQKQFMADVAAAGGSEDPAAALEKAITEAASQIIAKAIRTLQSELRAGRPSPATMRKEKPNMSDAQQWVAKDGGGPAWGQIQAGARALVAKSRGTLSEAEAVSKFLATPPGARLYSQYLREEAHVVEQHARSRLAPPDGVR